MCLIKTGEIWFFYKIFIKYPRSSEELRDDSSDSTDSQERLQAQLLNNSQNTAVLNNPNQGGVGLVSNGANNGNTFSHGAANGGSRKSLKCFSLFLNIFAKLFTNETLVAVADEGALVKATQWFPMFQMRQAIPLLISTLV